MHVVLAPRARGHGARWARKTHDPVTKYCILGDQAGKIIITTIDRPAWHSLGASIDTTFFMKKNVQPRYDQKHENQQHFYSYRTNNINMVMIASYRKSISGIPTEITTPFAFLRATVQRPNAGLKFIKVPRRP